MSRKIEKEEEYNPNVIKFRVMGSENHVMRTMNLIKHIFRLSKEPSGPYLNKRNSGSRMYAEFNPLTHARYLFAEVDDDNNIIEGTQKIISLE